MVTMGVICKLFSKKKYTHTKITQKFLHIFFFNTSFIEMTKTIPRLYRLIWKTCLRVEVTSVLNTPGKKDKYLAQGRQAR